MIDVALFFEGPYRGEMLDSSSRGHTRERCWALLRGDIPKRFGTKLGRFGFDESRAMSQSI